MKSGFDNERYIKTQSEHIKKRIDQFGGKLYLEFGGKLFDDFHAARVLPGFQIDSKIEMLLQMKEKLEAIIVINAEDIEKNKIRGDFGITYEMEVLRLIDSFREKDVHAEHVVITMYDSQPSVEIFIKRLKTLKIKVHKHYPILGYPSDIEKIVSPKGFGKNDYVPTTRPLVVVTAPGPGSGKMAVCLSQLYHEHLKGISAGYAKFETFPIWSLSLRHPLNIAYETATIDLGDVNSIDSFHLEAYNEAAVSYNRDIEIFPVLKSMLEKIMGTSPYRSPTNMGVNMVGLCIKNDSVVSTASRMEIIRRYYKALCGNNQGIVSDETIQRFESLMNQANILVTERRVIPEVQKLAKNLDVPLAGVELSDGEIITGKGSPLLASVSAMLLNALKHLAGIDDKVLLISPDILEPIQRLKVEDLGNKNPRLHADEMLVALSICAQTDPVANKALSQLHKLRDCEVHCSSIHSIIDDSILRKLGMNVTSEPRFQTTCLFQGQKR